LGPLLISATFEDIDFKFDTQFGFGDVKTTFWRKKIAWVWAREASPKLSYPLLISGTVEATSHA